MKLKHYLTITICTISQVAFMFSVWAYTDAKVLGMILWQIFALAAGLAVARCLQKLKRKQIRHRQPQIYTYTKQGVCLEGYYEQLNVG